MSCLANGLQSTTARVRNGPLVGWEEGLAATEISMAVMPIVLLGTMVYDRDRALAGLNTILV